MKIGGGGQGKDTNLLLVATSLMPLSSAAQFSTYELNYSILTSVYVIL